MYFEGSPACKRNDCVPLPSFYSSPLQRRFRHDLVLRMQKPFADLLLPDRRFDGVVLIDPQTGIARPMELADLYAMVEPYKLIPTIPEDVSNQITAAKHAFVYSWFCYDLATLAEQHAYGALENGLRLRAKRADKLPKGRGLAALLKCACDNGWLVRSEFDMPDMSNLLGTLPMMRNHIGHGRTHILPELSKEMLRICVEILNKVYATSPPP